MTLITLMKTVLLTSQKYRVCLPLQIVRSAITPTIMNLSFKARIRIVYSLILLMAIIIGMRLFFIQIVKGDYYDNEASKQYNAFSYDDFDRGSVYFTEKSGGRISTAL